ncbi:MAG: hypothetical protein ACD_46C00291G0008 [uncultured bacterium]|nr:MAG: hypothetical protein ACD_46C00291G0008 [uncultured bacterium]
MIIGILGGGQLARMLALAGYPLGLTILCIDQAIDACAREVTEVIHASLNDDAAVNHFLNQVDCVTIETENLPYELVEKIADKCQMLPNLDALRVTQDRLFEKELFSELTIPTAQYVKIDSWDDLVAGATQLQFPVLLKTRRSGYDGKGQVVIHNLIQAKSAWDLFGGSALILEKFIPFEFEVSIIAVRNLAGEMRFYSLVLNKHEKGILRISRAPFENELLQKQAEEYAKKVFIKLNYVGVMAIEFFYADEKLIGNEIAPRVHNTGHWTIEGAETSQFENHLRAITGLPLGSTKPRGFSIMINCIGREPDSKEILAIPGLHLHSYGKKAMPQRKLGHVTITANYQEELEERYQAFKKMCYHFI